MLKLIIITVQHVNLWCGSAVKVHVNTHACIMKCKYFICTHSMIFVIHFSFLAHIVWLYRQYGENAVPIPNSSTADKLSYLHKELQEKVNYWAHL